MKSGCGLGDFFLLLCCSKRERIHLALLAHVNCMKDKEEEGVSKGCGQSDLKFFALWENQGQVLFLHSPTTLSRGLHHCASPLHPDNRCGMHIRIMHQTQKLVDDGLLSFTQGT